MNFLNANYFDWNTFNVYKFNWNFSLMKHITISTIYGCEVKSNEYGRLKSDVFQLKFWLKNHLTFIVNSTAFC